MRILVTGGAGFIGSHIADRYIEEGHKTMIVDDLSVGRMENVNPQAIFHKVDITDYASLARVFADFKPEIINHHAAQIDVRKSVDDPVFDARINIIGSLNLMTLARQHKAKRFIFASSGGCVYGDNQQLPIKENVPLIPLSPYGVAKTTVEAYLRSHGELFGLDFVILRYSNVYGPRQDSRGEAGVIAIFIGLVLADRPCVVYGDGTQTRDFVFVGDVVAANIQAIKSPIGIYNIGTGRETSVNRLVEILSQITSLKIKKKHAKARTGELQRNSLDAKLAKQHLKWQPAIDIVDGIRLTFDYFQKDQKS